MLLRILGYISRKVTAFCLDDFKSASSAVEDSPLFAHFRNANSGPNMVMVGAVRGDINLEMEMKGRSHATMRYCA